MHARAAQNLLQVCEQEKIICSQVRTVGMMKGKMSQEFCAFKPRITARTSQSAGILDFLSHIFKYYKEITKG
jgi:hypothetical protein